MRFSMSDRSLHVRNATHPRPGSMCWRHTKKTTIAHTRVQRYEILRGTIITMTTLVATNSGTSLSFTKPSHRDIKVVVAFFS